jgi:hypothetical protein
VLALTGLGLRKKIRPWGVVYDSITKQPLDPALVSLRNLKNEEISSAITDIDGRYGFFMEPGEYKIVVNKTNYVFPSKNLFGATRDELYDNLYFAENFKIEEFGEIISKNIPLDPVKFDWNEFAKKSKNLMKFYSKWNIIFMRISEPLLAMGLVVSTVTYVSPYYL